MKKVVIIDDEAPARALLTEYLADYPELIIVGEANNGVDAVRIISEFQPEIVFLDIQMPGLTGFEVLKRLDEMPQIIFSTAYDQYALDAFEVHAVDYLLKPYTKQRFAKAIDRLLTDNSEHLDRLQKLTESLLDAGKKTAYHSRLIVSSGTKLRAVSTKEIIRIQADKDYSKLITTSGIYLSTHGISDLEEKLDPKEFIRIHRSSIINIQFLKEIERAGAAFDIVLENDEVVRVSRSYAERIRNLII